MEIGDKSRSKYKVNVNTKAYAYKHAGIVYCNSKEELEELMESNFNELQDKGYFSTNISNDFEISDCELDFENLPTDEELESYYKNDER